LSPTPPDALHATIAAVWRLESGAVVGALTRLLRDISLAEEMAQEALMAALDHWPREGLPIKPGAWLMTTAKHKALDHLRRQAMLAREHEALAQDLAAVQADVQPDFVDALDAARQDEIGDDLLRLIFTACHPALPREGQVALTLRLLGGLSTAEIARAHLLPEATVAQRIVRAKKALKGQSYDLPMGAARSDRLQSVRAVIYLIFNEGYAASSGADWTRPDLCAEALRLARVLAALLPGDAETQGLLALLEIQSSRLAARVDAQGRPVLLLDQDRRRWDALLIRRGLDALERAQALGTPGPYTLQAAIAACHARAALAQDTDWAAIVRLYDALLDASPSPVVALNRAAAVSMVPVPPGGLEPALQAVEGLVAEGTLADYPWLHSVHGDVLQRLGGPGEGGHPHRLSHAGRAVVDVRAGVAVRPLAPGQRAAAAGQPGHQQRAGRAAAAVLCRRQDHQLLPGEHPGARHGAERHRGKLQRPAGLRPHRLPTCHSGHHGPGRLAAGRAPQTAGTGAWAGGARNCRSCGANRSRAAQAPQHAPQGHPDGGDQPCSACEDHSAQTHCPHCPHCPRGLSAARPQMQRPPSTSMHTPVIMLASSLHRKHAALPRSSGVLKRPMGMLLRNLARISGVS
jgi:RNA polymerase sigma factor (sigma-70 family)